MKINIDETHYYPERTKIQIDESIYSKSYWVHKPNDTIETYPSGRPWVTDFCRWHNEWLTKDLANNLPCMATMAVGTGASKTHAMVQLSQLYTSLQTVTIIVHQKTIVQQHYKDVSAYIEQGYLTKNVMVETYQMVRSAIKHYRMLQNGEISELKEKYQKIIDHLKSTDIVFFDEIHTFSKSKEVKSLPNIVEFFIEHDCCSLTAVTATAQNLDAWYTLMMKHLNINPGEALALRVFNLSSKELATLGIVELPKVHICNTGLKLDIEVGEFEDQDLAELVFKSESQLHALAKNVETKTLISNEPSNLRKKLKIEDVHTPILYRKLREFIKFRNLAVLKFMFESEFKDRISLVYVPMQVDAENFCELFEKKAKKAGSTHECIAWHGSSDDFILLNGNAKVIQDRLQDPNDPLMVVVLVGMWKEAIDLPSLRLIYDNSYTRNLDSTQQKKGRLRNGGDTVHTVDALNHQSLTEKHARQILINAGKLISDRTLTAMEKQYAEMIAMAAGVNRDSDDDTDDQGGEIIVSDPITDPNFNKDVLDEEGSVDIQDILAKSLADEDYEPEIEITHVGWITQIHAGQTNCITIPAEAYLDDPDGGHVYISEQMKQKEFFKVLRNANKQEKVLS